MPNFFMRDRSVVRLIPMRAAAPSGPPTRPLVTLRMRTISPRHGLRACPSPLGRACHCGLVHRSGFRADEKHFVIARFIWCRLGTSMPFFLSLSVVPKLYRTLRSGCHAAAASLFTVISAEGTEWLNAGLEALWPGVPD